MKKVFSARRLASIFLVAAMFAVSNAYSQKTEKGDPQARALNKELLATKWKAGNDEYTFDKNGTSLVKIENRECPGTWVLKGKTLTINPKKMMWKKGDPCSNTRVLEIASLTSNGMEAIDKTNNKELQLTKQQQEKNSIPKE